MPFLIIDYRPKISYENTQGLNFLNREKQKLPIKLSSIPNNDPYPELIKFILALKDAEAIHQEKIIERIEALRRTSRQFMKFVNQEKINLQPTNVNQLIEEFLSRSIVIPKDIQLQKNLSIDIPTIRWSVKV